MIFTTKAEYGVRLLVELGRQAGDAPIALKAIAESEGLPLAYLERIVALLKKAEIVESTRGAHGGYRLAREAHAISLVEIVEAMEGPLGMTECSLHASNCGIESSCGVRANWRRINDVVAHALRAVTLADMLGPAPVEPRRSIPATLATV